MPWWGWLLAGVGAGVLGTLAYIARVLAKGMSW